MSATLKDVAREACVSVASVSRVLNGTGVVGEEIRARVAEVAARLNYVPNFGAQSLMTRRTRLIGMLLPRMHGEFFSELIRGADEAARELGMHLLISTSHEDTEETSRALRAMNGRVDGLLAMLPQVNGKFLQETMRSDLPIMLISTADVEHACGSMHVDNYGGAYAMVRHLAGCGHRYIAHIRGRRDNIDAEERLRGYRDAMAQVVPGGRELILHGDFTVRRVNQRVRRETDRAGRDGRLFLRDGDVALRAECAFVRDAALGAARRAYRELEAVTRRLDHDGLQFFVIAVDRYLLLGG